MYYKDSVYATFNDKTSFLPSIDKTLYNCLSLLDCNIVRLCISIKKGSQMHDDESNTYSYIKILFC